VGARVANNVYWGAYGLSFIVCVPFVWLFRWVPADNVLFRGLATGGEDASNDAEHLVEKWKGRVSTESRAHRIIETASA
jgi:hypothetical protein